MQRASRKLAAADTMITKTYTLVGEPKVLMGAIENMYLAVTDTMAAVMLHDRLPLADDYCGLMKGFAGAAKKHKIKRQHIAHARSIKEIIDKHRDSSVVFTRGQKLFICGESFRKLDELTYEKAITMNERTKLFVKDCFGVIAK